MHPRHELSSTARTSAREEAPTSLPRPLKLPNCDGGGSGARHMTAMLMMLPSVSLNHADLIPAMVATPSTVFRPISGMS